MATDVIMPQLGESVVEGTILRWHKQVGESIAALETLLEISTDKVDAEIPAPAAGVLLEILVPEGTTVVKGTRLAVIGDAETLTPQPVAPTLTSQPPLPQGEGENNHFPVSPRPEGEGQGVRVDGVQGVRGHAGPHITPVVARMAAEHHLDLAQIHGSGHEGRVTKKDVENYLAAQKAAPAEADLPPWERPGSGDLFKPSVEYEAVKPGAARTLTPRPPLPQGEGENGASRESSRLTPAVVSAQRAVLASYEQVTPVHAAPAQSTPRPEEHGTRPGAEDGQLVPLSPMRRVIAERLTQTAQTVPMVTTVFEVDLSAVMAHRNAHKAEFAARRINLTLTAYFALAAVAALHAVPALNSEWRAEGIFQHDAAHLGLAVALDPGLIVPVIRHAERLNLMGMAQAVNQVVELARAGRLSPDDTHGSTFTITNHGTGGSLFARPILNAPNAGILGVGTVEKRVRVHTDAQGRDSLIVCPCVYLTLTFDHRLADGAEGDAFLRTVKDTLEGWS